MATWQLRSKRGASGKKLKISKKKKKRERRPDHTLITIGEKKVNIKRTVGGKKKLSLLSVDKANVTDPGAGKTQVVKILSVLENPANPHYVRRNIVTKGAILNTEIGPVKVTSRPGQGTSTVIDAIKIKYEQSKKSQKSK